MSTLLEVKSLHKRFGSVVAVDGVSFAVDRGEVLGFLGPNGAGKTTTMKVITGYLRPTAGTAVVCGEDIRVNPVEVKRRVGYLPEGAPLYGDMTAAAFIGFAAAVRGLSERDKARRIDQLVDQLGLAEVMYRRIETLSKGFKRRVGLAQSIVHDPEVLILDEPTDGLDPNQKRTVRDLIRTMSATKAIVISTHQLEEVDAVCDRAIIIDRGRIVSDGTPLQLHARARGHNAVALRVAKGEAQRVVQALQPLPDVQTVDVLPSENGVVPLLVVPRKGAFIADVVGAAIRHHNVEVSEMHTELGKLDEVFQQVTTHAEDPGATPGRRS